MIFFTGLQSFLCELMHKPYIRRVDILSYFQAKTGVFSGNMFNRPFFSLPETGISEHPGHQVVFLSKLTCIRYESLSLL